ncbi:MAG: serine hydrolase [Verrucomicrobia bacterium]|nr:serine hydrolase [Verrucomicrobiota bacterium]
MAPGSFHTCVPGVSTAMRARFLLPFFAIIAGWSDAPAASESDKAKLRLEFADLARNSGLHTGIAVLDLTTGDQFLVNPDAVFIQGSCIRIHLITELFRQAAAGRVSLEEIQTLPESARTGGFGVLRYTGRGTVSMSLRDYATLVITVNDNSAANLLTDVLGIDRINASLVAQGTPEIKFRRRAVSRVKTPANTPENVGTPRAVMRALELIYRGQVVDRATSDAVLEMLSLPAVGFFERNLPLGVRFAGRSASGPTFRGDQGIVLLPGHPYVFCVTLEGKFGPLGVRRDYSKADAVITRAAELALAYFQRETRAGSAAGTGR